MDDAQKYEIDLAELFSVIWSKRIFIGAVVLFSATASVTYSLSLPNIYRSSALLSSADDSGGGIGGLLGQYSGLASMAGVTLPKSTEVSKMGLALEVIKSRAFIDDFINNHDILPQLLAVDYWDQGSRSLVIDEDIYRADTNEWVRDVSPPKSKIPSSQEAHKHFEMILEVKKDQESNLVTISVNHESPDVAKQWVDWLVEDVNETMRRKEKKEAQQAIEYLKRQAAETSLADLDRVFFELMQSQMQRMMLAEVRREYVLATVDPAVSPEVKAAPQRALICIFGVLLGGLFGLIIVLVRHYASGNQLLSEVASRQSIGTSEERANQ